jgi:hypothetical protein
MNPFIRLFEAPVEALTAAAYIVVLLGLLALSWWALGRNLLYLRDRYQDGWKFLVPLWYAARVTAVSAIISLDLLLVAAIIYIIG